jgi:two-component system phosphate regulon sensor histidine kinase PhoR
LEARRIVRLETKTALSAMALTAVVTTVSSTMVGSWSPALQGAIGASAAIAGFVLWKATERMVEPDVRALAEHMEQARETRGHSPLRMPAWLEPIWNAHEAVTRRLQDKIEQVNARRRELEIQARLAESERQHMEAIVASVADAVLVTDAFNEVAMANEPAAAALRICNDDYRHQSLEQVIHDPVLVKLIKDARESGHLDDRRHFEHRLSINGRSRVFDVTLACVPNAQREVAGVVTILRDISREKDIVEMQSDFVSSVSHELRTPLSSIKAYIEMLVDGEVEDDKTRQEFYNIIQSETHRLNRLIDNILNISRIESGIVRVQREEVVPADLIRQAVEVMQPQARGKRQTLQALPAPDCVFYADKDMLLQAILNLIGNAVKYTPEGGTITLESRLSDDPRGVTFEVSDTGVGVPPESIPHLFDKFYRVQDHKKLAKGTGLGLNLVKHIIETIHHGKVAVSSEVGKGSRFCITLPIGDASLASLSPLVVEGGEP